MNEEHLHRLRYETNSWNEWRRKYPQVIPDLSNTELNSLASKSTLHSNKSVFRQFQQRDFQGVDLRNVDLRFTKIWLSDLSSADFRDADLRGVEIRWGQLTGADLRGTDLRNAQFITSDLTGARFQGAIFGNTHFGYTRLVSVQGLDRVHHRGVSHIDQFSIIASAPLPAPFLDACGVPPHTIRMAELYAQSRPYYSCFISYSRRDESFVQQLREWLAWNGVPSWFAPQDMRSEEFQSTPVELERDLYGYVDEADRLLLIISPNILPSGWVGKEFQRARSVGRPTPVIPILIDSMPVFDSSEWNTLIDKAVRECTYSQLDSQSYSSGLQELLSGPHLDFRNWRDFSSLEQCLASLLSLLKRTT